MTKTNLVRPSRDGDQFHYLWAARRCLKLLSADSDLVAVSIEGPSLGEFPDADPLGAGEELIDIAEYFGSEDIGLSRLVRYMQLKHSTLHATEPWTASGLEKTIKGFAQRYVELKNAHTDIGLANKLEFWFVTNRPISSKVVEAITDASRGSKPRHRGELAKLQRVTGLKGGELAEFCGLLHFEDCEDDYWEQRNILFQEVSGYLPDGDVDAPMQLKELVTRRALSEGEQHPTISKIDILRALKTDESLLFPARCLIDINREAVSREQESEIIDQIHKATGPVIIHAPGGVGKSVFATQIGRCLPDGSVCITYDCFGNGQYRSATGYRHRHKDALVQIANELAAKSLCHPLIPTSHADTAAYVRAFVYRLKQAVKVLQSSNSEAMLCLVVDAADNAQMAAAEIGEARSFVQDLIRISLPEGLRIIFLCRSHRQDLLDPPVDVLSIELQAFSRNETAGFLFKKFPDAEERDIDEFHRLSSQNPRVQALALSRALPLPDILRLLGPNPTSVEDTISTLLDSAIVKLKDSSGVIEKERLEKICSGMAALRPLIPLHILSEISGVEQEAIKSFAYDIGRPLLVAGETIQFLDEPAETWFRHKFKPTAHAMASFITSLKPLANKSAYVASILPQLMLEAGQFDELVELALSSAALPDGSPLERRDVELQRLQFALKASLRTQRYLEATKLAFKAGGETAGDQRQRKLLQENTDLASEFIEIDLIQEIVSRRTFGSGWIGSHHVYEASLLSGNEELVGDARSRLRMAYEWLQNWAQMTEQERKEESISDQDIVELTLADLNIHGPEDAVKSISRWKPKEVSYRVGRLIIRRLVDHSRWADVDAVAHAAKNNLYLTLAIITELREVHKTLPNELNKNAFSQLLEGGVKLGKRGGWDDDEIGFEAVLAVVEAVLKQTLFDESDVAVVLKRYLPAEPPRGLTSRFSKSRFPLLRAYCLQAAIEGKPIELVDLAHADLKKEIDQKNSHTTSRDLREFQEDIGELLPWHKLWALAVLGKVKKENVSNEIKKMAEASTTAGRIRYREEFHTSNGVALLWMEILYLSETTDDAALEAFSIWRKMLKRPLFTPTLNALCRLCSQQESTKPTALDFATESYELTKGERSDAESKADGYLKVARSILTTSKADAKAYFNEAMDVVGKIGDENLERWNAILDLADRASQVGRPAPKVAYQFARCAELTYDYVVRDKHFEWDSTVASLCGLCPSSAIAILSRWRDRGFGWNERLLPVAIDNLIERNILEPLDALSLIGFRSQWDYAKLLEMALGKSKNAKEKELVSRTLHRYVQLSHHSSSTLSKFQQIVVQHGISLERLADEIASSEQEEQVQEKDPTHYELPLSENKESEASQWGDIFENKDIATANGLSQAYLAFKQTEPTWRHDNFFSEVIRRVSVGAEPSFIEAFTGSPEFSLYSFRNLLEQIPESWKRRPAVSHAFAKALKVVCCRYCMDVRRNRYYEVFPFELACSLARITQFEMFDIVLEATGELSEQLETSRLFSLVGLLTTKLSHDEALEAVAYGLDLFNSVLEDKDGDGPWEEALSPPSDIGEAIAGYIWSSLAAPEAAVRWEAAHSVLEICRFGRQSVIDHLMRIATSQKGGPYVDARLPFYGLHALQWLLIGLSRAALETPSVVAPFGKQLVDWALSEQPHVLIRQFAARTAIHLIENGYLTDEDCLYARLKNVNKSQLPIIELKNYNRHTSSKHEIDYEADEDRYFFGIDIGPYWYNPLGDVFALSQREIEIRSLKVVRNDFNCVATGRWDEDERARRKLYDEQHTHHSHGSNPRADSLHFYHAYHAMMIVAGQLLLTRPVYRDPDYDVEDEFTDWLARHDLTRLDGRWLSDRRDPEPLERGAWRDRIKGHPDYGLITDVDFEAVLRVGDQLNLWGHWTERNKDREQLTHICSALVAPEKSESLLRALATAKNEYDYAIPTANNNMEINKSGFELKGWVLDFTGGNRLDEYDPWAGSISFPSPRPAAFIVEQMKIETDSDFRFWRNKDNTCVMESQVWGHYDQANRNENINPNRGSRLQVSLSFITSILSELERDLIIEIQIDRRTRHNSYNYGKKDDERIKRSRLFLLRKDGKFHTC
ncbi:AVAST type 3 anti-phage nuclease/ATPase Avs3a [Shewanella oncorhynchi]|uniref:AVAST type 3 anti-phage nuclease/ATPase Avs3a n=1 Tax=Shewanella TaxID=22 RepID=UPI0021D82B9E|nr:AVAST type 3 anti-phage nuclease/ATPase Avs3a [Shewanella sp. SM69]MCU8040584.1 hypothetical protein [Shewanella sp. SM69]